MVSWASARDRRQLVATEIEVLEVGELGERLRDRRQLVATEIEFCSTAIVRLANFLVERHGPRLLKLARASGSNVIQRGMNGFEEADEQLSQVQNLHVKFPPRNPSNGR